ncbi:hypothetical protein AHAS_Ahas05G0066200 [Arachis hypogaea]
MQFVKAIQGTSPTPEHYNYARLFLIRIKRRLKFAKRDIEIRVKKIVIWDFLGIEIRVFRQGRCLRFGKEERKG